MPRVLPQAPVHDLALVVRILLELGELPVAHGLEEHADGPDDDAEPGLHGAGALIVHAHHHGGGDEPHRDTLRDEHATQGDLREGPAVGVGEVLVPRILGKLGVADVQVDGETDSPHQHEDEQQELRPRHAVAVPGDPQ
jgi:hypothetical protein